jgi:hypothetical protein
LHQSPVAEEGISARTIAEAVAVGLGVPAISLSAANAQSHFGWLAMFADLDMPASSAWTRAQLEWVAIGPGLLADLYEMDYGLSAAVT